MSLLRGVGFFRKPLTVTVCLVGLCVVAIPQVLHGQYRRAPRDGVYINLDRDFYEALQNQNGNTGSKTYSNNASQDYLRRIAVSSEYVVKTNLQIIQQQEKIIRLLESHAKQTPQQ